MLKYIRPVITLLLLVPCYFAFAQSATLNQTLANLEKHAIDYPYEKVYLHIDKPYYGAGDTIWFKGYTVIGPQHQLSVYSGVLNAELINERNEIIKSIKLLIKNGVSNGEIALPDTLKEGKYHLRAYTNWMRNAGTAYFYNNTIQITNPIVGNLFTKISHTYSRQNGKPVTNTSITYTNINGEPYAGREVKYSILQNKHAVINGNSVTDNDGRINISYVNPEISAAQAMVTTLQVGNKAVTKEFVLTPATSVADVQFFPESGSLINGLPSKVAFKAINPNGLGADVKGIIIDDQNKEIASFASTHLGMGALMLTPQQGRAYRAKIDFKDGKSSVVDLPKADDKGYVLSIDNSDAATVGVKILSSNVPGDVTLVAQSGGVICFAGKSTPGKNVFTASIPKSKFPSGIVQFTLFSSTGEPLNERLIFTNQQDGIKLNITADKNSYAISDKVKIAMTAHDNTGRPLIGNFSVAVINETELPVDETAETTILSHLLLTSDLTGYIEKPNYYFSNDNAKTQSDLDILMLTQGYHRYEWKKLMKDEKPPITYKPESGLTLSGRVLGRDNKPVVRGKVSLFSMIASGVIDTVTNELGQFVFDNIDYSDSTQLTIQAFTAKKSSNVKIIMDKPSLPDILNLDNAVATDDGNNSLVYLNNVRRAYNDKVRLGLIDGGGTLLDEVTVKSVKATALQYSSNLNGPGNANQVIYADNLMFGCPSFKACMSGRMAGVEFNTPSGNPVSTRSRNSISSEATETSTDMTIVYNGGFIPPGQVQSFLSGLNMGEISTIEVLRSGNLLAMYGSRGSNGVIIITSKHGKEINLDTDVPKNNPNPGFANLLTKGYAKAKVFYSPRYNGPKPQTADLRSTVYWNPLVQTDKSGNTAFEYFNTDKKGNYRLVVEGIDYAGHIGRQVYRYKVD